MSVVEIMSMAGNPIDAGAIQHISWARAVDDTENTPGTMLFCVGRTPQREQKFKWVGPIAELNLGLVAKRTPRIVISSPEDVKNYRIGIIRNSAPLDILKDKYGIESGNVTQLASDEFQFKMLNEGRVDLISQADTAAPSWLKELGMNQDLFEMVHVMKHMQLYIAFNKATDDVLITRIQSALDELKTPTADGKSRYAKIMQKYLSNGPIAMQTP